MKVYNCGGPLVCVVCAMKMAQAYKDLDNRTFAEAYREHAKKLIADQKVGATNPPAAT